jgi:hypothetical protein
MKKGIEITKVLFRKWKDDKTIIALFPELINYYYITCYMHVGQHSECDYDAVISNSTKATQDEYTDLKNELESLGYNLRVMQKCRPNFSKRLNIGSPCMVGRYS